MKCTGPGCEYEGPVEFWVPFCKRCPYGRADWLEMVDSINAGIGEADERTERDNMDDVRAHMEEALHYARLARPAHGANHGP